MQVLVVDDSALVRDIVTSIVVDAGYPQPLLAKDAREARIHIKRSIVDLILMDIQLPGIDGLQLTRQIRRNLKDDHWIPIIFLTIKDDADYLSEAIDAGGDDYLVKPVNKVVLLAKMHAMSRISKMKAALDETNLQLSRLTQIDSLTNTINRRGFDDALKHAWRLHRRNNEELCLLFLDIDGFKIYNDSFGHQQGDRCLRQVSELFKSCLRNESDLLARYGGEEFVILLPNTGLRAAEKLAKTVLDRLQQENISHPNSGTAPYITVSIGISTTRDGAITEQKLLSQADRSLYMAKSNGRNQLCCYEDIEQLMVGSDT